MAITQHNSDTDGEADTERANWFVFCQTCGFYPSHADDVAVGHAEESKAQNMADMHNDVGHRTFVVPSTWLDGDTRIERREIRGSND